MLILLNAYIIDIAAILFYFKYGNIDFSKQKGGENMSNNQPIFRPARSLASSKGSGIVSLSIVNTPDNGKRLKLSKSALQLLGNPSKIQLALSDDSLQIAAELPDNDSYYKISKASIYNSSLVREISEEFDLDFDNGRTSISFSNATIMDGENNSKILIFKIV